MDKSSGFIRALLCLVLLLSCNPSPEEEVKDKLDDAFAVDGPVDKTYPVKCYEDQHRLAEQSISRKLDILLVPDTSASIKQERSDIALGFHNLINSLPTQVDVNIGVMLAHGPKSSRSGALYKKKNEPLVLKTSELSIDQIKNHLDAKLFNPKTDNKTDGGEMGMISLLKGLEMDNLAAMRAQGMFREDAALAIIFIADEQDICAKFPEGINPVIDRQNAERKSFVEYCIEEDIKWQNVAIGSDIYTYKITPEIIYNKIKEIHGDRPLVLGGVLYDERSSIPTGNEDEIGYGYLDILELGSGFNVDLSSGDYGEGLSTIGRLATAKMLPENSFTLKVSNVDPTTIDVKVDDIDFPFVFDKALNVVNLVGDRDPLSLASINYCEDLAPPQISVNEYETLTNNPAFRIVGSISDNNDVSTGIYLNDVLVKTITNFVFDEEVTLTEGINQISLISTDSAGNASDKFDFIPITLDATEPVLSEINLADGDTVAVTNGLVLSGQSDEPILSIAINGEVQDIEAGLTDFNFNLMPLVEGDYPIIIEVTDEAGNTKTESFVVTVAFRVLNENLIALEPNETTGGIVVRGLPGAARSGVEIEVNAGFFNKETVTTSASGSFEASLEFFNSVEISATDDEINKSDSITLDFNVDTTLSGIIKDINQNPLPGVTVTILGSGQSAVTDVQGSFAIASPASGDQLLKIDGSTISNAITGPDKDYSAVNISVSIGTLQRNILERPIFLAPLMNDGTETAIVENTPATVVSPHAEGVRLEIPAGVTTFPDGSSIGSINMMEIPTEVTSLSPLDIAVPDTVVALEPSGLEFSEPVELTLPNVNEFPAGMQVVIFSKNSTKGIWEIDGLATVSVGGDEIVTNPGEGITHFSEVYAAPVGPTVKQIGSQDQNGADTFNGALTANISLPSFKILGGDVTPSLTYKSTWANPNVVVSSLFDVPRQTYSFANGGGARSIFGSASVNVAGETWVEPDFITAEFQSGDIYSGPMTFTGLPQKAVVSYAFPLTTQQSGIQPYTAKYKAKLKRMTVGTRTITEKKLFKGARTRQEHFSETRAIEQVYPSDLGGPIYIQNKVMSEAGQGWRINSTQRLYRGDSPRIMIEEGNGSVSSYASGDTVETIFSSNTDLSTVSFYDDEIYLSDIENNLFTLDFSSYQTNLVYSAKDKFEGSYEFLQAGRLLGGGEALKTRVYYEKNRNLVAIGRLEGDLFLLDSTSTFSKLTSGQESFLSSFDRLNSLWLKFQDNPAYSNFWWQVDQGCTFSTSVAGRLCPWYGYCVDQTGGNCRGEVVTFFKNGPFFNRGPGYSDSVLFDMAGGLSDDFLSFPKAGYSEGQTIKFNSPLALLSLAQDELLIADTGNNRIRKYSKISGISSVFAGNGQTYDNGNNGTATSASIFHPRGLAKDAQGNIYVSSERGYIRRIDTNGTIYAFAGKQASEGGVLDDVVPASNVLLGNPTGMVVDNDNGYLYVADTDHHRVVRIDFLTLTATTVAGNGSCINSPNIGDGSSAIDASLCNPKYVGLDSNNNLLIADIGHNRIRKVTFGSSGSGSSDSRRYLSSNNDNSELIRLADDTFVRKMRDGSQFFFDENGLQNRSLSRTGREVTFDYDSSDRLIRETDPVGNQINYYYSGDYLSSIVDPAGRNTSFINSGGRLTQVNFPDGTSRKFSYDDKGLIVQEINQRNILTNYEYNQFDRLKKVVRADGSELIVNDGISSTIGNSFTGGNQGELKSVGSPDTTDGIIDSKGNETKFSKDESGFVSTITDAKGNTTTVERDLLGRPVKMIRPDDSFVTYKYDPETGDLLEKQDTGTGAKIEYEFDTYGSLLARTNTRGEVSVENTYDETTGVLQKTANILNQETSYTYNSQFLISSITNSLNQSQSFDYDNDGNLIKTTDNAGRISEMTRDDAGNIISTKNANGEVSTREYDVFNRLISVTTPRGDKTRYEYLSTGELERIIDPLNNVTSFEYDIFGQLTKRTTPSGAVTTLAYDTNGNLISETDPNGNIKEYTYNELDQLTKRMLPDNTYMLEYDVRGNITSIENDQSLIQFDYIRRESGDLVSEIHNEGQGDHEDLLVYNNQMSYDSEGNRTFLSTAVGDFDYFYDVGNRLVSLKNHKDEDFSFAYDVGNRLTQITRPGSKSVFTFDDSNYLTKILHSKMDNTQIGFFDYVRDNIGNTTKKRAPAGDFDYDYDLDNQLTSATNPESANEFFEYDSIGNRIRDKDNTYTYQDNGLRLEEDSFFRYSYDLNGNTIGKVAKDMSSETYYEYTSENQLIKITFREAGTTTKIVRYVYDALGRRVKKSLEVPADSSKDFSRYYAYDAESLLYEADASGTILASYTSSGLRADDFLAKHVTSDGVTAGVAKTAQSYFYQKDGLGTVTDILSSSGLVLQHYSYSAFGEIVGVYDGNSGDIKADPVVEPYITFTAREYDSESDLYYFRARYYDIKIGRFLSEDGFAGVPTNPISVVNRYTFNLNDPVNRTDPSGNISLKGVLETFAFATLGSFFGPLGATLGATYNVNTSSEFSSGEASAFNFAVIAVSSFFLGLSGGYAAAGFFKLAGASAVAVGAASGAVIGAVTGGIIGGTASVLAGGSFANGVLNGIPIGAIFGAIGGAIGGYFQGLEVATKTSFFNYKSGKCLKYAGIGIAGIGLAILAAPVAFAGVGYAAATGSAGLVLGNGFIIGESANKLNGLSCFGGVG